MPRRSLFAALAVLAVTGVAGCGGSEDAASRCEPAPAWFLAELDYWLRHGDLGPTAEALGDSAAVQSSDSFKIPRAFRENAWFVSVDVRPRPGIETWAMSDEAFRTGPERLSREQRERGANLITGAGPEPSAWGPGSPLDLYGIPPESDGLMESVKCVKRGLP